MADWETGRGEEVDEGFVGWMKIQDGNGDEGEDMGKREKRRSRGLIGGKESERDGGRDGPTGQQPLEVQIKGVRVCKECWGVVS